MAELILTEEEKAAANWFELDDAAIGKLVKKTALSIMSKSAELDRVAWHAAAMLLCGQAASESARELTINLYGFEEAGVPFGDWKVTVVRVGADASLDKA